MMELAQDAAETPEARIEDKDLDGKTQAVEVREALEHPAGLSPAVSEKMAAYQGWHSCQEGWEEGEA